jgi:phospholipase/carboxylesterase
MSYLPAIEIEPTEIANASVIWLHGLGASGDDFSPIVPALGLAKKSECKGLHIRYVFPHAPSIPISINGGMTMPAWYDILSIDVERKINEVQFTQSCEQVRQLIEREIQRGISSEKIVIAGFSQGGAVAYQTALSFDQPLAGLMAMSTYIASHHAIELQEVNKNLPISIYHGTQDNVVPEVLGKQAMELLQGLGFNPTYKNYVMAHSVSPGQIKDIGDFIAQVLTA